jgi:hypothetical protein
MTTVTLPAFIEARLDDLAEADWHVLDCNGMPYGDGSHCCEAQRWLARDVAAKRAILAEHCTFDEDMRRMDPGYEPGPDGHMDRSCLGCGLNARGDSRQTVDGCSTRRALAAAWADHPDYLSEWTPEPAAG